jgi:hypothetical protein
MMMLFKACPKCGGDVYPEPDLIGQRPPDFVCLQCGHYLLPAELRSMRLRQSVRAEA